MKTQNTTRYTSYKEIMLRLSDEFQIDEIQEHIVNQHIHDALNIIGKLATAKYLILLDVVNYRCNVPCNCFHTISITHKNEEYLYTDNNDLLFNAYPYLPVDLSLQLLNKEYNGDYKDNYVNIPRGIRAEYIIEGNEYVFNVKTSRVYVEYNGIKTDEEGYPLIEQDIVTAVLSYVVNRYDYAKLRARMIDGGIYQESTRQMKELMSSASRNKFNRNELEKAMKVLYSYSRTDFTRGN